MLEDNTESHKIYLFTLISLQSICKKPFQIRKCLRGILNSYTLYVLGITTKRLSTGQPIVCRSSNKNIKSISISYSGNIACLAVSSMECIGVDIEINNKKINRYIHEINKNGWNINALSDWTNAEALSKAYGSGFTNGVNHWLDVQHYKIDFNKIAVKSTVVKIPNHNQTSDCTISIASNMGEWYNKDIEVHCYSI